MPPSDSLRRFRDFRKSLGQTPRLHRNTIELRGLKFAVYSTDDPGNGSLPVICVNGGLIFDHRILWPALSSLAAQRQVILYDQRGRGHSAIPPAPHASRFEFDASDLAELPAALDLPQCHLLAHSWGGGIAMLSTAYQSDRVASLTLLNTVGLSSEWLPRLTDNAAARLSGPALDRLLAADAAVQPEAPTAADPDALSEYAIAISPAWFFAPELAALLAPPRSDSVTGGAVLARLRRDGYDWRAKIGQVSMPTLLVHGTSDVLTLEMAEDTARSLGPAASVRPVTDAGHNAFLEQPSIVFGAIDDFLSATERALAA